MKKAVAASTATALVEEATEVPVLQPQMRLNKFRKPLKIKVKL